MVGEVSMNFTVLILACCAFILVNFTSAGTNCYFRVIECKRILPANGTGFVISTMDVAQGKGKLLDKKHLLVDEDKVSVAAANKLKDLIDSQDKNTSFELFVYPTAARDLGEIPGLIKPLNLVANSCVKAEFDKILDSISNEVPVETWMYATKIKVNLDKLKQPMQNVRNFKIRLERTNLDIREFVFGNGDHGNEKKKAFIPSIRGIGQMLDALKDYKVENLSTKLNFPITNGYQRKRNLDSMLLHGEFPVFE